MIHSTSSGFGSEVLSESVASGSGMSHKPIFVTTPKFDCMNI